MKKLKVKVAYWRCKNRIQNALKQLDINKKVIVDIIENLGCEIMEEK